MPGERATSQGGTGRSPGSEKAARPPVQLFRGIRIACVEFHGTNHGRGHKL